MSENIRGITFAEQAVTPADDAIVRRALLGDGILTGCEISYSGSTLTMAAGYIIACGRSFQIITAQNWAVVDATSGVARLVLTIDLTKTATENAFSQIDFAVEYASAEDGFADLVQEDINISGTKYQITAAVVSLGTGGITGIVSKLEKTEGGGGLNFKVVAGLDQPGSATENTIWLKIPSMTGWVIDANQPEELTEGMVWISAGTKSVAEFNALKKNGIQVYPLRAKQMVSDSLVDVTTMIYQGGTWKLLWDGMLYDAGDEYTSITGGWEKISGTYTKNSTNFVIGNSNLGSAAYAAVYTANKIDLRDAKKLCAVAKGTAGYQSLPGAYMVVTETKNTTKNTVAEISLGTTMAEISLDVSSLSGSYYIGFLAAGSSQYSHSATVEKVQVEV